MTEKGMSKAGPITLAVGLIAGGVVLLLYNFGAVPGLQLLWKLWPLLLIGVGVEYFVKKGIAGGEPVHFHAPSILLIVLMILAGGVLYAATNVTKNLGGIWDGILSDQADLSYSRAWESGPVEVKPGDNLLVENNVGKVRLLPAEAGGLSARAVIRSADSGPGREAAEKTSPEIGRNGSRVFVRVPAADSGRRNVVTDLEVAVPAGIDVRVESGISRVAAENINNNLSVIGNTGTVELKQIGGNLIVENNTGRIVVYEPGGDVRAKTNTGTVEVSSTRPLAGKYDLQSSTGMVRLELPGNSDLAIDAEARTGRVSSEGLPDGNFTKGRQPGDSFNYTLGAGKGRAVLRAGTGAVQITVK